MSFTSPIDIIKEAAKNPQADGLRDITAMLSYLFGERIDMLDTILQDLDKHLAITLPVIFAAHQLSFAKSLDWDNKPLRYEEEDFKELHRLAKMATNVYNAVGYVDEVMVDEATARKAMEMADEDAILLRCNKDLHLDGIDRTPKFMVFTDKRSKSIVIAIRGSTTK